MKYLSVFSKHQLGWNLSPLKLAKARKLVIHYLSQFANENFSNEKKILYWLIYVFYKIPYPFKVTNPSKKSIQFEFGCAIKICHVSSLS